MIVTDWMKLAAGLAMLLMPLTMFHSANTRYRVLDRHWLGALPRLLAFPWHWLDFIRTVFGIALLEDAFRLPKYGIVSSRVVTTLAVGAVLLVAVILHILIFKKRDYAPAPFAIIIGVIFAMFPPLLSVLSVILAFTIACGFRVPAAFFFVVPISLFAFGALLYPNSMLLKMSVVTAVCWVAPVLAVLVDRKLILAHLAGSHEPESLQRESQGRGLTEHQE